MQMLFQRQLENCQKALNEVIALPVSSKNHAKGEKECNNLVKRKKHNFYQQFSTLEQMWEALPTLQQKQAYTQYNQIRQNKQSIYKQAKIELNKLTFKLPQEDPNKTFTTIQITNPKSIIPKSIIPNTKYPMPQNK